MKLGDGSIRMIREQDLQMVLNWRNSERVSRCMFNDHLISWDEHYQWFTRLDKQKGVCLIFELFQQPAGVVNFSELDRKDNKCSWGFYLGETTLPAGSGLLMGYHALQYLFEEMEIRKLNSKAFVFNKASIKYHKKLGFVEEGCLLRESMKNGRYEDVLLLALFADRWQQHRIEVQKLIEY